jgi:hypothetical protein
MMTELSVMRLIFDVYFRVNLFDHFQIIPPMFSSPEEADRNAAFLAEVAPSTEKNYEAVKRQFTELGGTFPLQVEHVLSFIRYLSVDKNLLPATVKKYVSALKHTNKHEFGVWTETPEFSAKIQAAYVRVERRIPPEQARQGQAPVMSDEQVEAVKLAVTSGCLVGLGAYDDSFPLAVHKDSGRAVLVCLALCLRAGELVNIAANNITVVKETSGGVSVTLTLPITKTEVNGQVILQCREDACRGWCAGHCLTVLRDRALKVRKDALVFPRFKQQTSIFTSSVKAMLKYIGVSDRFSGHSCRRTGAQRLLLGDVSPDVIKSMCRWKSDSMLEVYGREALKSQTSSLHKFITSRAK